MNKIVDTAVQKYEKELKRIAKRMRMGKDQRFLDKLEKTCAKIARDSSDRISELKSSYLALSSKILQKK